MGKRLEDRSLEELWQLFPIFLVPYKKEWAGLWLGRLLWQYAESSGWAGLFLSIGVLLSGGWCLWAGIYSLHRRAWHGELKSYVSFGISVCFLSFLSFCLLSQFVFLIQLFR